MLKKLVNSHFSSGLYTLTIGQNDNQVISLEWLMNSI